MKKLFAAVAIAAFACAGTAQAKEWKEIRIGVDASYAPFESKAPDGKLVGFDIDLGNEICKRVHAKCVWVENDFDGLIPGLKARKFDGVLSSMTITPEREQQIAFSKPLFDTPTALVAKKGSGLLPTAASLKGKSVGVEQGTTQEAYAKKNWEPAGVKVVPYQNQDQVYQDLLSGRLDAALQDKVQADLGFLKQSRGAGFAEAGEPIPSGAAAMGMRKEDADLKAAVDKAIDGMMKDGTYKKLESKYFDFDVAPKSAS
ncbi:amino acid ABC transporter substrate-binding protein (PAAT family) [Trinickia symbiotica]|uniref:ABC transporter substrate-binding protein n=1 Tax=Trinickia symbiotica TaxID=863227 RepID=A0A2N7XAV7_9BURK|nr:ABC transporter substrate-binding protein [Trinickia symbiotica]PMS38740.1 ABC transporter substrate-binding protein [Trinickia symbiotica]PPK46773.1 amino acid ABC transporter substrate-binding protein (PAAT family) [Trinickia symbiotica]